MASPQLRIPSKNDIRRAEEIAAQLRMPLNLEEFEQVAARPVLILRASQQIIGKLRWQPTEDRNSWLRSGADRITLVGVGSRMAYRLAAYTHCYVASGCVPFLAVEWARTGRVEARVLAHDEGVFAWLK